MATSRYDRPERRYWKLALAITVMLAMAMTWAAMQIRARYELEQLTQRLEHEQESAVKESLSQLAKAHSGEVGEAARASAEGHGAETRFDSLSLMSQNSAEIPTGTVACLRGYQVERTATGDWKQLAVQQTQPCIGC